MASILHVSCSERMRWLHRKMRTGRESWRRNLGTVTREEQQEGKVEGPGVT